jgi:hypothetical protein
MQRSTTMPTILTTEASGIKKRVSFRSQIDLVAVDGTVNQASLRESDLFGFVDTEGQLGFDYGSYSIHHHHHPHDGYHHDQFMDTDDVHISSYKKLLPRSALAYVKQT